MSFRVYSILLVLVVLAATVGSTNAFDFGVRYVANNGYETGHKICTDEEHLLVQVAIDNAMMSQRRDLRGNKRRMLNNCPNLCAGMSYATCWNNVPTCQKWLVNKNNDDDRRELEEEPTYVILDDEFYKDENEPTGTRNLEANTTFGITMEQCNEYKAKLFMTILSALDNVSTECENLILSPGSLQCMVIVPPPPSTGSPSTVPSFSPSSRPTGSPVR